MNKARAELCAEKFKTGKLRFYVFNKPIPRNGNAGKYPYFVCDNDAPKGDKALAQFKNRKDAELFSEVVAHQYAVGERE